MDDIIDVVDEVTDIVEDADDIPGLGTLLAVTTAGSVIAAGIVTGGKFMVNKARDAWSRHKAMKSLNKVVDKEISETEATEATEE